jgi:hypothetical protein
VLLHVLKDSRVRQEIEEKLKGQAKSDTNSG